LGGSICGHCGHFQGEAMIIAPIARILARYASGALVAYGAFSHGDAELIQPDLALMIGAAMGALVEGVYALARKRGWTT
jgi:hypothetical protein